MIYYYDESFHDKSVTLKEQGLNITKENNFFFYIGAFLCFECEKEVSNSYSKLENDVKIIKRIRQQDELKGKNFKKNNFKNGFASFTDETSDFYYRFFDILHKDKTKFHLTFFNQYYLVFEPFIREIFSDIGMKKKYGIVKLKIMEKNFEYSFNKMIKEYNPFPLLECVFQELKYLYPKQILEQSKIFLNEILPYIKKIKKKEREYQAFNEILDILNKSNPSYKIIRENKMNYSVILTSFNLYLLSIYLKKDNVKLILDKNSGLKGNDITTYYNLCEEQDTIESIHLRITDIFCNLFSRLMKSASDGTGKIFLHAYVELTKINFEPKQYLPYEWFELNEKQFKLIKSIFNFLQNDYTYFSTYSNHIADEALLLFSFINLVSQYETLKDFNSAQNHQEMLNTIVIEGLEEKFKMMY